MENLDQKLVRLIDDLPSPGDYPSTLGESQQIALLQSQVFRLNDDIFVFREIPKQSPEKLDIMFEHLRNLTHGIDRWYLIVDLRGATSPDKKIRNHLRDIYIDLEKRGLRLVSLVVKNRIIQLTVGLVGMRELRLSYVCTSTFADAINHIQLAKQKSETENI